ncbi:polysaccharide biosynthesis/export family protein [Gaetbulibacter aquiaggeris]|uniref:Polysaccharide biosynthesis/export family protein n=1 Tax=Gaetbulibacter aquiaggeris TaxID=1735373 RepID=A0ABW7MWJ9_9FLAO
MSIKKSNYLLILASALFLTGCMSSKKIVYFQESEAIKVQDTLANFQPQIQLGDLITIQVSASDPLSAEIFNLYETPSTLGNPRLLPYLVDGEGNINFPVLGKLKVAGLTTQQIGDQITQALTTYLVAPIVNVRLTNFKITVMGEVKSPGTFAIPNERITLVEALGLAGDLTIQAKRNTVLLIREKNGARDFVTIDLTNKALFNSPYYYLAQNDVLYVEPNKTKVNSAAVGTGTSVLLSSLGILISLITLFSL